MLLRTKNERMLSQEGGKWGGEMLEDYFPLVKYPISPTRIAFPKVFRPNWGKFSGFPRFRAKSLPTHSNSKQLSADLSITVFLIQISTSKFRTTLQNHKASVGAMLKFMERFRPLSI